MRGPSRCLVLGVLAAVVAVPEAAAVPLTKTQQTCVEVLNKSSTREGKP